MAMNANKKTARIVGVLFIIATTFFMIGQSFYEPIMTSEMVLENAYPERIVILTGILIEFFAVCAIILIPAFLYPVLKKDNEALALGYAGFRFLEAGFLAIVMAGTLALINISQNFIDMGRIDASYYSILVNGIQSMNSWAFMISVSFLFPVGAMILYFMMYRTRLIPNFLSVWGFLAAALLIVGVVLMIFEVFSGVSPSLLEVTFALPIAVQEMVMAIWLIFKGFNPSAIAPSSAKK